MTFRGFFQPQTFSDNTNGQEQHAGLGAVLRSDFLSLERDPQFMHAEGWKKMVVCLIFNPGKQLRPVTTGNITMPPPLFLEVKEIQTLGS